MGRGAAPWGGVGWEYAVVRWVDLSTAMVSVVVVVLAAAMV